MNKDYISLCLDGLCSLESNIDNVVCAERLVNSFGKNSAYNAIVEKLTQQTNELSSTQDALKTAIAHGKMVQSTISFRIGRLITYLSRKFRQFVKSYIISKK